MTATLQAPNADHVTSANGRRTRNRGARTGLALTMPAVLLMLALTIVPIVSVLQRAFSGEGRDAFVRFADSPDFGQIMLNTLLWTAVSVLGAVFVGYAAALVMQSRHIRLEGLWRGLFMLPWIIPGVVGATIWRWNYSVDYGLINHYLMELGVISAPVGWLSNPDVVLYALATVQVWSTAPFVMLLVSAALANIPGERYEAARIDGAGPVRVLRYVILPAIRATTGIATLTLVIWALNAFTIIWVSTRGGPAGASTILPVQIYQAFQTGDEAMVAAVATIQLAVCLVFAVIYIRSMRTDLEEA